MPAERLPNSWQWRAPNAPRAPRARPPLETRSWSQIRDEQHTTIPAKSALPARADHYPPNVVKSYRPKQDSFPQLTSGDNRESSFPSGLVKPECSREPIISAKAATNVFAIMDEALCKALGEQKKENVRLEAQIQRLNTLFDTSNQRAKFERLNTEMEQLELENKRREIENRGLARRISDWNIELKTKDCKIEALKSELREVQITKHLQGVAAHGLSFPMLDINQKDDRIAGLEQELADAVTHRSKLEKQMELMKAEIERMSARIEKQDVQLRAKGKEITTLMNKLEFSKAALDIREERLKYLTDFASNTSAAPAVVNSARKRKTSDMSTVASEDGEIKEVSEHQAKKPGTSNEMNEGERQELYRKLLDKYETTKKSLHAGLPTPSSTQQ